MNFPSSIRRLTILAGQGAYPMELARCSREAGVDRIDAICFRGETDRALARWVDRCVWIPVGALGALIRALETLGAKDAVMAGLIRPTNLFRVRMDSATRNLLARLPVRNAETIFGAVGEELRKAGVTLHIASLFMERAMPEPGLISEREPTESEWKDLRFGAEVARAISDLDIGQTVVVKTGTILAVEGLEGTDAAILRAGKLGGAGGVVVKAAKRGHDMRFDIPVIGTRTFRTLRKARVTALGVEAGCTILLQRDQLVHLARKWDIAFVALPRNGEGMRS